MAGTTLKVLDKGGVAGSLWRQLVIQFNKVINDLEVARKLGASLVGSAVYDPASLADGVGATTTVTVTGAALGDFVTGLSFSLDLQGITMTAYVSAANTVAVRFQNESGGTLDLASGTIRVRVSPFATGTGLASEMTAAKLANGKGTVITA